MPTVREALFLVGGVAIGLLIAKQYARTRFNSALESALGTVGLGGYAAQVEGLITPQVVG